MMNILLAVLVLDIVILAHEFGHYIFAKKHNCAVLEFSIGIGPKIYSFRKEETLFCLRLFPILGYVRVYGEQDVTLESEEEKETLALVKQRNLSRLDDLSLGKQVSILLGGVLFNILLALFLSYFIVLFKGMPTVDLFVHDTFPNSPAQAAGLKSGDKIIAVQNEKINNFQRFIEVVGDPANKSVTLSIIRDEKKQEITVRPKYYAEHNKRLIGVNLGEALSFTRKDVRPQDYLIGGGKLVWSQFVLTLKILGKLFTRRVAPSQLMGVVGIVGVTSTVIGNGNIFNLFLLLSLINVNLAVINALPFPLLDGFACVMAGIEAMLRRKISLKIKMAIQHVGIAFLVVLFLYITFNDIMRFIMLAAKK